MGGGDVDIQHLKAAEITEFKGKLYIDISWNMSDAPSLKEDIGYDQKGDSLGNVVYSIIFIDSTLDNRKFQCQAIIAMGALGSETRYSLSICNKIIEVT